MFNLNDLVKPDDYGGRVGRVVGIGIYTSFGDQKIDVEFVDAKAIPPRWRGVWDARNLTLAKEGKSDD